MPKETQRKKILYVITKSNWGGAQRYVYDLATRMPPDRFSVAVACGGSGALIEKLASEGIRVIPIPWLERDIRPGKEISALLGLLRVFRQERPDIVHLNSSKVGGLGAVAARMSSLLTRHRSRVIFTVHGWGFGEDRPWYERFAIAAASWFSTLFQDRIILIDAADYRVARRFIPLDKLALIHHGITPIEFIPRETARRFFAERIGREIAPRELVIGVNAELTKNKGQRYLVKGVAVFRVRNPALGMKVLLISDGEDRRELEREISALGLAEHVFLIGFVPEAGRYLKALDLFVLPSLKEGLPYALMEAMAAELPIVASRVGGVPDLIQHEKTGLLVPPKDPARLAAAMQELSSRRDWSETLGRAAWRKVNSEFRIETMIERTRALYESV